jgi:pimeloyl-ACP methyl ester carboxylesterase
MSGAEQRVVPGTGPVIAVDVAGDDYGRPLVLLHGLSASSSSWAPVIERTAAGWRSYALDFRGHGRSDHTPGRYRLSDYIDDTDRLLHSIGEPAVVVGHSLGAVVAAALAQDRHPLVAAVFLEDPPLYVVEPRVFAGTGLARGFGALRTHIERLQTERAPVESYRDLLAASPHPAGDLLGDHLHDDALWSRASSLAQMDVVAITDVLDGTTFGDYDPDRPLHRPALVVRADPAYDAAFRPSDEPRLHRTSPDVAVVAMPGAGHNIRGDRATRHDYLDVLCEFLARQPVTKIEIRS